MWIKHLADGECFREAVKQGITWTATPMNGILQVSLIINGQEPQILKGYESYWHSRRAIAMEGKPTQVIAERIQGLREDGEWDTIEWNGKRFITYIARQAFGKPVTK